MALSKHQTIVSYILKLVVFAAAIIGTCMSAGAGRGGFMGGSSVFMYFTIQSNIALALISLIGGILLLRKQAIRMPWQVVKFVGTISITLTGVVFCFVLAPTMGNRAWSIQNVLTHVVVPIVSVADFFLVAPSGQLHKRHIPYVILPPLAYAVYAGIGYAANWQFSPGNNYPYFFLNWGSPAGAFGFSSELPFMGCVWWILLLLAMLILWGWLYLWIVSVIQKRKKNLAF